GSINVDVEYMNYAGAHLKFTKDGTYNPQSNEYVVQNEEARDLLRPVLNLRIGGELVLQSQYFLRGGYAYYPQPYKSEFSEGASRSSTYAIGGGIKVKRSTIDLAYNMQTRQYNYNA